MSPPCTLAAFLTGRSVRGNHGLSESQLRFQRQSPIPASCWLPWNFPYLGSDPFPPRFSILLASLNNTTDFLLSRTPSFRRRHRAHILEVFDRQPVIVLLAGSCGLELLANLHLPASTLARLHVFAYGPVSRKRPQVASLFLLQGKHDLLSRCFHRHVHARLPCGHMGYLDHPRTLELFAEFCRTLPGAS